LSKRRQAIELGAGQLVTPPPELSPGREHLPSGVHEVVRRPDVVFHACEERGIAHGDVSSDALAFSTRRCESISARFRVLMGARGTPSGSDRNSPRTVGRVSEHWDGRSTRPSLPKPGDLGDCRDHDARFTGRDCFSDGEAHGGPTRGPLEPSLSASPQSEHCFSPSWPPEAPAPPRTPGATAASTQGW
jgi:hypothetical protein